jgi:hypothetical protein
LLGGTADIREGIEEGDPLKVALGTLQTVMMFAGIEALGRTGVRQLPDDVRLSRARSLWPVAYGP